MKPAARRSLVSLGSVFASTLLLFAAFGPGRLLADADDGPPAAQPVRVTTQDRQAVVKLTPAEIQRVGLETRLLPATTHLPSRRAYGVVLDLQPLWHEAAALAAGRAAAEAAAARLDAAKAEYERVRHLHEAGQNVSTRDLQAAEAAWREAEATAGAGRQAWHAQQALLTQDWGPVLAGWTARNTAEAKSLAQGTQRLLRVVLPGEGPPAAVPGVTVQNPDGRWSAATLVSAAPRADPEFQGAAYLLLAAADGGLVPGLNVPVSIPVPGAGRPGVVVPASAVIWWQGRAWVYLELQPGVFGRQAVAVDEPDERAGYFVATLPAARPVVVTGAAVLLSEETRPAVAPDAD